MSRMLAVGRSRRIWFGFPEHQRRGQGVGAWSADNAVAVRKVDPRYLPQAKKRSLPREASRGGR